MRSLVTSALVLIGLLSLVAAWTAQDHEIFRLRDEIEKHEGEGVTFYDFLEITRSATQADVNRAYRKRSRVLHPDKAKSTLRDARKKEHPDGPPPTARELRTAEREASARFTRLGLIAEILRADGRDRYDHFLDHGFPAWRGTGYYYARFRPGLGSVLIGLFVFAGGAVHYLVLILGYQRQRAFVDRYVRQARRAAWGTDGGRSDAVGGSSGALRGVRGLDPDAPAADGSVVAEDDAPDAPRNRRERREQDKEAARRRKKERKGASGTATPAESVNEGSLSAPTLPAARRASPAPGPRKHVEAENGKTLVVDAEGSVFLQTEDEDTGDARLFLLDPDDIERPNFRQTALYRLPIWLYRTAERRIRGGAAVEDGPVDDESEVVTEEDEALGAVGNGKANGFGPSSKARKRKGRK